MELIRLREHLEWTERAAAWFHEKWCIPEEAYRESIEACQQGDGEPEMTRMYIHRA